VTCRYSTRRKFQEHIRKRSQGACDDRNLYGLDSKFKGSLKLNKAGMKNLAQIGNEQMAPACRPISRRMYTKNCKNRWASVCIKIVCCLSRGHSVCPYLNALGNWNSDAVGMECMRNKVEICSNGEMNTHSTRIPPVVWRRWREI
jgi:hypothetical protein